MKILGLMGGVSPQIHHDPSAALIVDGKIVAAVEEERLVRVKKGMGHLPINAIAACLREANLTLKDIDVIAHVGVGHEDLQTRVSMYLEHYFGYVPPIDFYSHPHCHLAQAYFLSPFDKSMVLSFDGYGDDVSVAFGVGEGNRLKVIEERGIADSLGHFYSAIVSFLGFEVLDSEYKVMGLAPFGNENAIDLSKFLNIKNNKYHIDLSYMRQSPRATKILGLEGSFLPIISRHEPWYTKNLVDLLGEQRHINSKITQRHIDIAAAAQAQFEAASIILVQQLQELTGLDKLCLAGGCSLNCSSNYVLSHQPILSQIFVPPASSDSGIALGAALLAAEKQSEVPRGIDHAFLGPSYGENDIMAAVIDSGLEFEVLSDPVEAAAVHLAAGDIIGWYQGRSEYGPRALGNRSILADPTRPDMKDKVNMRVKFREEFRPFAPAVPEEDAADIFHLSEPLPFMTVATPVRTAWKAKIPAVTHVDGTARVQTVNQNVSPLFHRLLKRFGQLTGVPVLLNTSFNLKGEPIVETPRNAVATFSSSGLAALVMGNVILRKRQNGDRKLVKPRQSSIDGERGAGSPQ